VKLKRTGKTKYARGRTGLLKVCSKRGTLTPMRTISQEMNIFSTINGGKIDKSG
jgi:hypothetical protein